MTTEGRSNTSRRMVKQAEHATCPCSPPPRFAKLSFVGWKKF
jgi:hypothetical protein